MVYAPDLVLHLCSSAPLISCVCIKQEEHK